MRVASNPSSSHYNHNQQQQQQSNSLCNCIAQLEQKCRTGDNNYSIFGYNHLNHTSEDHRRHDSEFGRMIYTCAMLLMFAGIIILLMIRSIKRSKSSIEVETLLDSMRYREELDIQQRQKRKLQKAKNKISAWLTKNNNKMWVSSPQIMIPSNRTNSLQSSGSFIPEIVISNSDEFHNPRRMDSYTPSLSLIYDFDASSRKGSMISDISVSGISENSAITNHSIDLFQISPVSDYTFDAENRAARQRSASRADTGESVKSAPIAALTAAYKVRTSSTSTSTTQNNTINTLQMMKHSSTSSLSPNRHKLQHQHEITIIDVP